MRNLRGRVAPSRAFGKLLFIGLPFSLAQFFALSLSSFLRLTPLRFLFFAFDFAEVFEISTFLNHAFDKRCCHVFDSRDELSVGFGGRPVNAFPSGLMKCSS